MMWWRRWDESDEFGDKEGMRRDGGDEGWREKVKVGEDSKS